MKSAKSDDKPASPTRASMAEHIAIEAGRLARMAKQNEFSLLAYLIDMAVLEAWREAGECGHEPGIADDPHPSPGQ